MQTTIDRDGPVRTDAASGSRVVPIEIRHGIFLSVIPAKRPDWVAPHQHTCPLVAGWVLARIADVEL
jgi:hypothetical protein